MSEDKQTFPYRNVTEADAQAQKEVLQILERERQFTSDQADEAFKQSDFRMHAVYCMASNKLVGLLKHFKESNRL